MKFDQWKMDAQFLVKLQELLVGAEQVSRIRLVLASDLNYVCVILFQVVSLLE